MIENIEPGKYRMALSFYWHDDSIEIVNQKVIFKDSLYDISLKIKQVINDIALINNAFNKHKIEINQTNVTITEMINVMLQCMHNAFIYFWAFFSRLFCCVGFANSQQKKLCQKNSQIRKLAKFCIFSVQTQNNTQN